MEYCSPLWAGAPTSHLSRLHAVETKAFMIIGISRDEAESFGLSLPHCRQVGGLSVFYHLLSGITPPSPLPALSAICSPLPRMLKVCEQPPSVKLPKSRITAHLHAFIPLFSRLWNKLPHSIQSHSSLHAFKTAVHHHLLSSPHPKASIFSSPVNPPQTHLLQIPCFPS